MERFIQDIRFALRLFRKSPAFAAIAILTLAIGIGANTAIFSVTNAVLLRPLPYPDSKKLVRVWQNLPKMGENHLGTAPPEFAAYRDRTRAFSNIAGFQQATFDVTGGVEPEHLPACAATASLFGTLGARPLLGRTFVRAEEMRGSPKVVVLSYAYWRRHYGGDPHALGKIIRLNEQGYQIVGIMPSGFIFPSTDVSPGEPPALWVPLSFTSEELNDWASSFDTGIVARLRSGVSLVQADDDVRRVAAEFEREHTDIYSGNLRLDATAEQWSPEFHSRVRTVLLMLCGSVAFVLLIACANIANLLLARAGARQREISIRRALGAAASRIISQVLTETAILTVIGGAAGCGLAYVLLHIAGTFSSSEVNVATASLDGRVLLFNLLLCGLTCLLCGFGPAWILRQTDANAGLKQSARQAGPSRSVRRISRLFILAEVASSVILLIGAALLLRTFGQVIQVPLGFNPDHALVVRTTLNRHRYASADHRHAVERAIEARLSSLPGVSAAALTTHVPLADERQIGFVLEGRPADEAHWADNALVSENYFRAMGIQLLSGRTFSDLDTPTSSLTAVVNESMARQYWPKERPIGKVFNWGGRHITVIGVVADVHVEGLDKPAGPTIYNFVYQIESGATSSAVFVLRTKDSLAPLGIAAAARNEIWSVDRGLPIIGVSTLRQVVSSSLAVRRASLILVATFAVLAMMLSLIGIYGVLSQAVTQRTAEMGVRLAVGAKPAEIIRLVIGDGFRMVLSGIALGTAIAVALASSISKLLFHVPALDPISFGAGVALLVAVSVLASYLPARRAAQIDPMVALKYE